MEAARSFPVVYGEDATKDSAATKWFCRFKQVRFDLADSSHSRTMSGFPRQQRRPWQMYLLVQGSRHRTFAFYGQDKKIGSVIPQDVKTTDTNGRQFVLLCFVVVNLLVDIRHACPGLALATRNGAFQSTPLGSRKC